MIKDNKNLADLLTTSRIIIAIPVLIFLLNENLSVAWILILIAGLTDYFDGKIARIANSETIFGARMDPLADKILVSAPYIWIVQENIIPTWAIWIIFSRELLVSGWRSNHYSGGSASILGKLKTLLQFICILLLLWPENWGTSYMVEILRHFGYIIFWPSLLISIYSGYKYLKD